MYGSTIVTAPVFAGRDKHLRAIELRRGQTPAWTPLLQRLKADAVADTFPTLCRCDADFNAVPAGERGITWKEKASKEKIKLQYEALL